jgi:hypothetical protein
VTETAGTARPLGQLMQQVPSMIGLLSHPLSLTASDLIGIVLLILSLAGNGFQLYRQRVYGRTIYNGLVGTFNSIGWLLARTMNRTAELREKSAKAPYDVCLSSFRDFSLETEWHLRELHEQLVAVAKTLRSRDQRWQAGQFGLTDEDLQRIRMRLEQMSGAAAKGPGGP